MALGPCLPLTASLHPHTALSSLTHLAFLLLFIFSNPFCLWCMVCVWFLLLLFEKCLSVFLTLNALLIPTLYPFKIWNILPMNDLNQALLLGLHLEDRLSLKQIHTVLTTRTYCQSYRKPESHSPIITSLSEKQPTPTSEAQEIRWKLSGSWLSHPKTWRLGSKSFSVTGENPRGQSDRKCDNRQACPGGSPQIGWLLYQESYS